MIQVVESGAPIGAEIRNADIAGGVDDHTFETIRNALHEYSVIVLRGQSLTVDQQRAFCARFGAPEPKTPGLKFLVPGYTDVLCVSNILDENGEPLGLIDGGRIWHTDNHFDKRPTMYSMLYALEIPRDPSGRPQGATWFASTAAAYDRLPEEMKARLNGLTATHSIPRVYEVLQSKGLASKRPPMTEAQMAKVASHPVIRTHPVTGRKCIYVSEGHTVCIDGLDENESRSLIDDLQSRCIAEDLIYRHEWDEGIF